jgi:hypothetical protein
LVGEPTSYDHNSKEMRRKLEAQQMANKYHRVSMQARGELAGGTTAYGLDSAEMQRELQAQANARVLSNPNQMLPGSFSRGVGMVPDAVHNSDSLHHDQDLADARAASSEHHGGVEFR